MRGHVLEFSVQTNSGIISTEDGSRYTFAGSDWRGDVPPGPGMTVDFEAQGTNAVAVCHVVVTSGAGAAGAKNKVTAGLLAILLGWLGIHKFYLGYTGPGLVFLLVNTVGLAVTWLTAWAGLI